MMPTLHSVVLLTQDINITVNVTLLKDIKDNIQKEDIFFFFTNIQILYSKVEYYVRVNGI